MTLILHGEQLGVHGNSIALLEEQVNVLQNTDVTMEERLDNLEAADMITEHRLNELEMAINDTTVQDDLIERVTNLENTTASQQGDIDNLANRDIAHDIEINALQDVDSGFEQRIKQLEDDSDSNTNNMSIGFHARLTNTDLPRDTPILYDDVLENKGDRYSPSTGIFTADTAGFYYFEQYWITAYGNAQYLYIWKNGVIQCSSLGIYSSYSSHPSPSCSAVMELSRGDEVYVTSNNGLHVYSADCTGFTGFLIQAY